ncbi:Spy/CpxP family protein refolding chaperone [Vibrio mangrovi]|uniref:Periplasmic protein CpxP n=1 Tax=Vibrio mangrovi TaxID=474394 RepID=A0A1Y6IYX4_9VIBR|nr:Spy/CpxP family protein refolding chaperone [Vibrio mangrovi]MDW6002687.1 Spy/CpxP family protein refolding chaperone [Vibrio mangrovi]SMS02847.1 Periplasmic protein CpxP precursor [Vibrio mangrovi]
MRVLTKVVLAAVVLPVALGSMNAFAGNQKGQNRDEQRPMCQRHDERGMFRSLNLTSDQQNKLRALRQGQRAQRQARMQGFRQEMDKLLLAKNFDDKAAQALAQKMVNDQVDRRVAMMRQRHEMLSILTPEQKTQWHKMSQEKRTPCLDERGHAGYGKGHGKGNGPGFMDDE